MVFYHGTSEENWNKIKTEGILWGCGESYRYTYLTPDIEVAKEHGKIILEVEYEPVGVDGQGIDNYGFNPPAGMICWQFSVFIPINIDDVKML